ncbi:ABC transporter ATP-binding protein [Tepiditoga spiralis]|uniref:ABC transporter ATP-binding protein n=1 Tax=Tepiditoga spiralis TaxID=2108365 RepID=A0A7G1G9V5_9BACT|nr:ABC transporter ATP-binding protein [Tepiditoga spiralis]BBE32064.1 ABC transporter ATP-binding protein [Tepiditoga spiralis]
MNKSIKIFFHKNKKKGAILLLFLTFNLFSSFFISEKTKILMNKNFLISENTSILKLLIIIVFIYLILLLTNVFISYISHKLLYSGIKNLRNYMLSKIIDTKFEYFIKNKIGNIWGDFINSTNRVSSFYKSLILLPINIIQSIVYFYIITKSSSKIGILLLLLSLPIILFFTFFLGKKIKFHENKVLNIYRNLYGESIETFSAIKQIKLLKTKKFFTERFNKMHSLMNDEIIKTAVYSETWTSILNIFINILPILIVTITILLKNEPISQGNIIILYTFVPIFINSIKEIYNLYLSFLGITPYIKSMNDILNLEKEYSGSLILKNVNSIEFKNFSYNYDKKKIYIPDLKINSSEKVMILGESGRGKSTLFNCLIGLFSSYNGEILISNLEKKHYDINSLREKIILLSQDRVIFEGSLEKNLFFNEDNFNKNDLKRILKIVKLEKFYKNNNRNLNKDKISGGEKARINLAQAILKKPDVLLLDEVLSSLDEKMEKDILENLIKEYPNMCIVVISHRLKNSNLFDKVIDLNNKYVY